MQEFHHIKHFFLENNDFILVGHKNADGDCYGTMIAFHHILTKLGKNTQLVLSDPIPDNYNFLFKNINVTITQSLNLNNKPVIMFECNNFQRCGVELKNIGKSLNFDHHPDNDFYASVNVVDKSASSVGEMAVFFISEYFNNLFSTAISNALYTAIHTDTGGFAYSNTTKKTFEACSILMDNNLDSAFVCTEVYENKPINKLKLTGFYLENLKTIENGLVSYGLITKKDLIKFNCKRNDAENFGGIARAVKGAEIGIFLMEIEKDFFKLSIRSKGKFIVNEIAKKYNGGGHKYAAGCTIQGNSETIVRQIASEIINNSNNE